MLYRKQLEGELLTAAAAAVVQLGTQLTEVLVAEKERLLPQLMQVMMMMMRYLTHRFCLTLLLLLLQLLQQLTLIWVLLIVYLLKVGDGVGIKFTH